MLDLNKLAAVLDASADHIDALEAEKVSSAHAERRSQIDKLAENYSLATGEEMPDSIRNKLANSDQDVVSLLKSMMEKQAGGVESLGGPSNLDDQKQPTSIKEAAALAEDRFGQWITS